MKKSSFVLALTIAVFSYLNFGSDKEVKVLPQVDTTVVTIDESDVSLEDLKKLKRLKEISQKGITDKDIEAIKKNLVPDGHRIANIKVVNGSVEIAFDTDDLGSQNEGTFYHDEEEARDYILSLNKSEYMPQVSSEEAELVDGVMSDFGYEY